MTYFHTCVGCASDKNTCGAFAAFKEKIKGLGITSVKWRCLNRVGRFHIGQPVWALTTVIYRGGYDLDEVCRDEWPGHIIKLLGSSALVYIKPGVQAKDHDEEAPFEPKSGGNGFCRIPLSRLVARDGDDEEICKSCELPAFAGHIEGYSCSRAAALKAREAQG